VFLVDTSVLIDVITVDPTWGEWSAQAIESALSRAPTGINQIIYAEVSGSYPTIDACEAVLTPVGLERFDIPYEAAFLAGAAHHRYRRAGGRRHTTLPDFFIGAHSAFSNLTLITRDPRPYRSYFPDVPLITP